MPMWDIGIEIHIRSSQSKPGAQEGVKGMPADGLVNGLGSDVSMVTLLCAT